MKDSTTPESTPNELEKKVDVPSFKKKFWTSEKILSLSAIFMSACTLIVLIYQTNLMRQQQAMSVYPYLELGNYGTNTPSYKYSLVNTGVGPALIEAVRVTYKGKIENIDLATHLDRRVTVKDSLSFNYANIVAGHLIPPDHMVNIAAINRSDKRDARKLYDFVNEEGLDFEIEYASIYGERWVISKKNSIPRKLD